MARQIMRLGAAAEELTPKSHSSLADTTHSSALSFTHMHVHFCTCAGLRPRQLGKGQTEHFTKLSLFFPVANVVPSRVHLSLILTHYPAPITRPPFLKMWSQPLYLY